MQTIVIMTHPHQHDKTGYDINKIVEITFRNTFFHVMNNQTKFTDFKELEHLKQGWPNFFL